MARVRFEAAQRITEDIVFGGPGKHHILFGRILDSGRPRPVHFDADENFVVIEVGKRGSGKSFNLGAALEAFAARDNSCSIAHHGDDRRAVLLLDPLDVHWPAVFPICNTGSPHVREQYALLARWPEIRVDPVSVQVFMPAGRLVPEDPAAFKEFFLPVADLTPADFALLLGADLVTDPAGMLIGELHDKVTRTGFTLSGRQVAPNPSFSLVDLVACLDDDDVRANYATQTLRAVRQRLTSWQRDPLFRSSGGTPVTQLLQAGNLSILCLNRLSEDMRSVLTGVLVRKIKAERSRSSQIDRREAFDPEAPRVAGPRLPRCILAIDEAQMLLPASGGGHARTAVESYILEGRNFGLSIWLATQRPRGAISERAVSQLDSLIVHQLSTADDLTAVRQLLQAPLPTFKVNDKPADFEDVVRSLEKGMALVSCAISNARRCFIAEVRPRVVAHGGKAF
ncbi:MAG: ATP-binding protein [Planctomycetes bacterium]|nr:ATP-binding protein [Planctomycetota bacterium]